MPVGPFSCPGPAQDRHETRRARNAAGGPRRRALGARGRRSRAGPCRGIASGGSERGPCRGGVPAHAPHASRLARLRRRADAAACPTCMPGFLRGPTSRRRLHGRTTPARTTTRTSSPPPGSPTAPLYEGRMREMLRNEIRYTNALDGIPATSTSKTGVLGPPSLFGAAEYAKDGLARDHGAAGAHALVLPHGGHDGRPDGARAGRERLRAAARRGRRAQRRRPADAGPPRRR